MYVHRGVELRTFPTAVQRTLARKLVAAGADVVVGSHAHVVSQEDGHAALATWRGLRVYTGPRP
jgi:hypothetical protein